MKLVCLWSSGAVLASDTRRGRAGGEGGHPLTRRVVFKNQTPSFFELKHLREWEIRSRNGRRRRKKHYQEEQPSTTLENGRTFSKIPTLPLSSLTAPTLTSRSLLIYLSFFFFFFYNNQCLILYALIFILLLFF